MSSKDISAMTPVFSSICHLCDYFVSGIDPSNDRDKPVCRAFPEGIPHEILNGGFDHRKPLRGKSITFQLAAGATQFDVNAWEQEVLEIEKFLMLSVLRDLHGGGEED